MNRSKELSEILNKLFTNKKFMATLMTEKECFSIDEMIEKMSKILCYYIATGDGNTNYPYPKIEKMYEKMARSQLEKEHREDLLEDGVAMHSFNGYQKETIEKYGFDNNHKLSEDEKVQRDRRRNALNALEELLVRSRYLDNQEKKGNNEQQIFLTLSEKDTMAYALEASPERLYLGPLREYRRESMGEKTPIIIGEKKNTFFKKVLQDMVYAEFQDEKSVEYKKAMKNVEEVVKSYCTLRPSFALINIADIKDIPVCDIVYDEEKKSTLKECIVRGNKDLGDLATLRRFIPDDSFAIVDVMDSFEMRQLYAKSKGLKVGQLIMILAK